MPSDSHKLLALLEQKRMLLRVYSQNIDGLEQVAGVSPKKMVYAHGSLQWATCCTCKRKVTAKDIEPAILKRRVPLCQAPIQNRRNNNGSSSRTSSPSPPQLLQSARGRKRPRLVTKVVSDEFQPEQERGKPHTCNGVLKPGVTFFGEALHDTVRKSLEADRNKVDALIVIGTSLSV
jgi:NAD-dependent histone deacetylase SIR2